MGPENEQAIFKELKKCPTGISGFDEITEGGIPKGRPTLVCGGAGSGKTLFAMEFLVNGATQFNETGVFISFEENESELTENVASLGWDLAVLSEQKKSSLTMYISKRVKSKRPASSTWTAFLSASKLPCAPSMPKGSQSTPSKRFLVDLPMSLCYVPRFDGCFDGSKIKI